MTPEQIAEIKARLLAAHKEVTEIAEHGKGGRWMESSPEHPGSGPIIEASLMDALDLLAEVDHLRKLTSTCTCGTPGLDYEGPQADCAIHGAIQAFDKAQAEVERLTARVAEMEEDSTLLEALRTAGVDNWDGYSYAHEILREWQNDGDPS
jgi:hypothetical protein